MDIFLEPINCYRYMAEIVDLTSANLSTALEVVRECFGGDGACLQVKRAFDNPDVPMNMSPGDVAVENGKVLGCQIGYPKFVYFGKTKFLCSTAGCLCLKPGISPVVLLDLIERTMTHRTGKFYFVNTACNAAGKTNELLGAKWGPNTFEYTRFGVVNKLKAGLFIFKRKILKVKTVGKKVLVPLNKTYNKNIYGKTISRFSSINSEVFDVFWEKYVNSNEGVVSSRSSADLCWMFGERLSMGEVLGLGCYCDEKMYGYIILSQSDSYGDMRWEIADMIAINNNVEIIDSLLKGAVNFLRKHTAAQMLESTGFPTWIQPVLSKYMPHKRPQGRQPALYRFLDKVLADEWEEKLDCQQSWFWGPYDGDASC